MEIKEIAVIGGGIFILLLLLFALKWQNQKIRSFLTGTKRERRAGTESRGPRRDVSGQNLDVDDLAEGDIVAEDVSDPAGKVILLEQGTRLTGKNIDKLKKWNVKSVWLK